ncbi:glycosyltransferase family 4 protein [Alteromonas sp. ASW11-130]|uniref:glycosyltransferase family 4 protein n=1 Tax=Alteromonas sp. ASW11-130 TaxID=3015775 RepID=UPI002242B518|nr:glycosyltransferase family 4 protein [Alteromonas sp. ASW11-130]MCW8090996.1 glycosyltransferase family 4 protein [Alteromonas sp. ASW11-130]
MKIKVLHVEFNQRLYGGGTQVCYLLNALNADAFESVLVCSEKSDISRINFTHCDTHKIEFNGNLDVFASKRIIDVIEKTAPDIIHIHSRHGADWWGGIAASYSHIPAILTRRLEEAENLLGKLKYRYFDAVVSISEEVYRNTEKGLNEETLHKLIYPGVATNESKLCADGEMRKWLARAHNVPSEHKLIASFAQLIGRKGQADIILAFEKVISEHDNVSCLLFGEGNQLESYASLIKKCNLQDRIKLCGFTSDVTDLLAVIDIIVHPSHSEGLGATLMQAAACKKPVIAYDVGGVAELVEHNKTGLLVDMADINGLADAIIRLLDDETKASSLGNRAYEKVKDKFSVQRMKSEYEKLYREVYQGHQEHAEQN